ncbi:MAG: sulfotransferase domain-containing protein, partial [Cyanobacteria bacterium J06621_12]
YQRGIDWYLAHFPSITDRPDFLTGEATPNYLRFPQIPQRIKDTFPQTKIIFLLRNPVDRAISWHYHKLNSGLTQLDLATAISTEIERLATVTEAEIINTGFHNPDNIISSLYLYKIKPWIEVLGREQFLILKSEDFYRDPAQEMEQVFKFLDLPSCALTNYPKVNAGSYQSTEVNIRKTLQEYFAPYNQRLEEYLGMEFNWN